MLWFLSEQWLPHLLGDLENSQESQRSQNTNTKGHARPEEAPNNLKDAANNDLKTCQI